jgi:hypothetical protein
MSPPWPQIATPQGLWTGMRMASVAVPAVLLSWHTISVSGQSKTSCSFCHALTPGVKPLPAAGSMRTDYSHCLVTAAHA